MIRLPRACRGRTAVRFPANSSHMCCVLSVCPVRRGASPGGQARFLGDFGVLVYPPSGVARQSNCTPALLSIVISFGHCTGHCTTGSGLKKKKKSTSVSPRSSPLGTFRAEERLRLSDRNSILMMQINVYLINPVVTGFQM